MSNKDYQNGFIAGAVSGGVVEVIDTTEIDNLEDLIDNSAVLDSTEGTATEKVEELIDYKKSLDIIFDNGTVQCMFERFEGETIPQLDYSPLKTMRAFAYYGKITHIDFYINSENATEFKDAFAYSTIKTMVGINTSKAKSVSGMFYNSAIEEIQEPFNLSSTTNSSNTEFIHKANSLREIRFVAETIKWSITITSAVLSAESIQSIAYGLATVKTAQTLTLNSAITLTDEQKAIINAKGWTLAQ